MTGALQGAFWAGAIVLALAGSYLQGDGWGGIPWWVALGVAVGGGFLVGEIAGFVSWWFTRYIVDVTELRIDSGVLTRRSRRAPFERIQSVDITEPLLARIAGMAALRIDLAGSDEANVTLRFLRRDHALELRRLLLDQAHGRTGDHGEVQQDDGTVITRVPGARILLGLILSLDFLAALGVLGFLVLAAIGLDEVLVLLGGVIPVVTWAGRIVGQRLIAEWDFTLRRTTNGLRIERGLLSRTSQTIPLARVQGVAIEEPLVWRRLHWRRLEVDVAGGPSGDDDGLSAHTLLPIADSALADALVAELVPGPRGAPATRATRRSRWFAPVGWRYRWIELDEQTATSSTGWLNRRTSTIPHHKAQSVALRQGPLQRRCGVATVEVHTPHGPVDVDAHHLDAQAARRVAFAELTHAGRARRNLAQPLKPQDSTAAGGVLGGGVDGAGELP